MPPAAFRSWRAFGSRRRAGFCACGAPSTGFPSPRRKAGTNWRPSTAISCSLEHQAGASSSRASRPTSSRGTQRRDSRDLRPVADFHAAARRVAMARRRIPQRRRRYPGASPPKGAGWSHRSTATGGIALDAAGPDRFAGPWSLHFQYDAEGRVKGVELHRPRLWNLWFIRVERGNRGHRSFVKN